MEISIVASVEWIQKATLGNIYDRHIAILRSTSKLLGSPEGRGNQNNDKKLQNWTIDALAILVLTCACLLTCAICTIYLSVWNCEIFLQISHTLKLWDIWKNISHFEIVRYLKNISHFEIVRYLKNIQTIQNISRWTVVLM